MTVNVLATITGAGTGPFTTWSVSGITLSPDQTQRGCRYGDQIDMLRPYQTNRIPGPIYAFVENGAPGGAAWGTITAAQMKPAIWGSIIHGCRGIVYFIGDNFKLASFQTIQGTDTISIFDQAKAQHYLIQALTPVIYSPFAEATTPGGIGYVKVVGDNLGGSTVGFRVPWRPSDHSVSPNELGPYPYAGNAHAAGCPTFNFNNSFASAFEVMAKFYQGTTQTINGITLTKNRFWIFSEYRGSQDDGSLGANANTLLATFTIANTGASTVTRIYSDAINGAASSNAGTTTRVKCADTSQIINGAGDTVIISGTSGITGLNGTFTPTVIDGTHFDVPVAFSGALIFPFNASGAASGAGNIVAFHTIPVTGGTTFTDTFTRGSDIRIYGVN
jgi:hypothetical protein